MPERSLLTFALVRTNCLSPAFELIPVDPDVPVEPALGMPMLSACCTHPVTVTVLSSWLGYWLLDEPG
jgi:hypothetical protein